MFLMTILLKPDVTFVRKHEKRHDRPYGCTNQHCRKAFGSKSDWKRHESTQHFENETWRCEEHAPHSKILECAEIFHEQGEFVKHLRQRHSLDDPVISRKCESGRVGNNYQTSYWCGFCRKIIPQKDKRGSEAQNERYDHIDDCHFKKGQHIDEWYSIGSQIPRADRFGKQGEEDSEESDEERNSTIPDPPRQPSYSLYPPGDAPRPGQTSLVSYQQQQRQQASHARLDANSITAGPRSADQWYCVSCNVLPVFLSMSNPKSCKYAVSVDLL